jgi:hypothetical protein
MGCPPAVAPTGNEMPPVSQNGQTFLPNITGDTVGHDVYAAMVRQPVDFSNEILLAMVDAVIRV